MKGNSKTAKKLRRRRINGSSTGVRKRNTNPIPEPRTLCDNRSTNFTKRHFWKLSFCIIAVWIIVRVFNFSLLPLSYNGLYIIL